MAASIVHDDDPGDISCICGVVDQDIEGILLGYGKDDNKELERLMVEECDKQLLLNSRDKIFELAKEKILRCLRKDEAGKLGSNAEKNDAHEEFTKAASFIEKWQLISRRAEHKVAHDIIEMLAFTLGSRGDFPSKILREASMNKGNISGNVECDDLVEELRSDLETAADTAEIQIVADNGSSQIHCVSLTKTNGNVDTTQVDTTSKESTITHTPEISETSVPKVPEPATAELPVAIDEKGGNPDAQAAHRENSANTDQNRIKEVRVCSCTNGIVKQVREMACQTDKDERPVFRSEFDHHTDYAVRKMRVNEQNIKGILKWKSLVNNRFRDVESAHDREVIAMRAQYRSLAVEFADFKARDKQGGNRPTQQPNVSTPVVVAEQMDTADEWVNNSGDESIWDVPHEQSTPAAPRQKQADSRSTNVRKGGANAVSPHPRGVRNQPTPGQSKAQRSAMTATRNATQGSSQKAYRIDIEMVEVADSASQSESSSESERDEPEPKKTKSSDSMKGKRGRASSEAQPSGSKTATLSERLRSLAEPASVNEVEMADKDDSWAELDQCWWR